MTLRAKCRGEWRIVSKAMARVFVRRGIEVVDDDLVAEVEPVTPPAPQSPASKAFDAIDAQYRYVEARVGAQPDKVTVFGVNGGAYETKPVDAAALLESVVPAGAPAPDDLTDDELERLTAPDGE